MVSQNLDQYFFVFRLHQCLQCLLRQCRKRFVRRCKNCEWAFSDRVSVRPAACKAQSQGLKEPFDAATATTLSLEVPLAAGGWCRWGRTASGVGSVGIEAWRTAFWGQWG